MPGAYLWAPALRFSAMARLAASRVVFSSTPGFYPIAWRPSTAAVLDHRPALPPGFWSTPSQLSTVIQNSPTAVIENSPTAVIENSPTPWLHQG